MLYLLSETPLTISAGGCYRIHKLFCHHSIHLPPIPQPYDARSWTQRSLPHRQQWHVHKRNISHDLRSPFIHCVGLTNPDRRMPFRPPSHCHCCHLREVGSRPLQRGRKQSETATIAELAQTYTCSCLVVFKCVACSFRSIPRPLSPMLAHSATSAYGNIHRDDIMCFSLVDGPVLPGTYGAPLVTMLLLTVNTVPHPP